MLYVNRIKKLSGLSFSTKKFIQFYNWKNCAPSISVPLKKDLSECRVAIVSSAGLIVKDKQEPFDSGLKMGDSSYRIIPSNISSNNLEEYHRSDTFDHSGVVDNPFSVFPIPHLIDLAKEGFIGSVSDKHISLMGSIINPSQLIKQTIPEIFSILKDEQVDLVIFIPV